MSETVEGRLARLRSVGDIGDLLPWISSWELALVSEGKADKTIRGYTDAMVRMANWLLSLAEGTPAAPNAGIARSRTCHQQVAELRAGGDAEFGECAVQVRSDGAGGQEQPFADLAVGQAGGGQPDDVLLLGGQLGERAGRRRAGGLAGGA
jgi:hypothetical protein